MEISKAFYTYRDEHLGRGGFYYTKCCGNRMYSIKGDPKLYDGSLCPKCYIKNKKVILFLKEE